MLRRVIRALRRAYQEDSEIKEASWDRVAPREPTVKPDDEKGSTEYRMAG